MAYDLSNMSLPSSAPPGPAAQSNHVNHNHVTQARKRRSVFTVAQSGFICHITQGEVIRHIPPDHTHC